MSARRLTVSGKSGTLGNMTRQKFSEAVAQLKLGAVEVRPDTPEAEEFRVQPQPKITYEPRVTFQLKPLTQEQRGELRTVLFIVRMLEARVRQAGSIRKAAEHLGVSKTFLAQVLRGQKPPGYALAREVGYVPKTLYLRARDGANLPLRVDKKANAERAVRLRNRKRDSVNKRVGKNESLQSALRGIVD